MQGVLAGNPSGFQNFRGAWLSISVDELDISASANAWDSGLGTFIGILLIVLIAWEVLRLTGNAPEFGVKHVYGVWPLIPFPLPILTIGAWLTLTDRAGLLPSRRNRPMRRPHLRRTPATSPDVPTRTRLPSGVPTTRTENNPPTS